MTKRKDDAVEVEETDYVPERIISYGKEQIIRSKRYAHRKDLLGVLLSEDIRYTYSDVDALIERFMKGVK